MRAPEEAKVKLAISNNKLDPVGSTVRYEMMKLCTGSVYIGLYEAVAVAVGY